MSAITSIETRGMLEAYQAVYSSQQSLEEEIFETIAYALISQGYTATDVLEYFANVDEEVIIEDIVSIAEGTLLVESIVPKEYIQEQYEILNEALPAIAAGLGLAGKALLGAGARRTAGVVLKRMAGPGVRKFVGGAVKNIGGAVGKVKDVAKGALNKLPGGSGGKVAGALKTAGKWALGGAAFEAGSRGVKALMGDKGSSAKTAPSGDKAKYNASAALGGQAAFKAGGGAAKMKQNPKMSAADVQKLGMKNIKNKPTPTPPPKPAIPKVKYPVAGTPPTKTNTPTATKTATDTPASRPAAGAPATPTATAKPAAATTPAAKPAGSAMDQWAKANPKLAAAKAERDRTRGTSATTNPLMKDMKSRLPAPKTPSPTTAKTGFDLAKKGVNLAAGFDMFDVVKGYLIGEGYADTEEAALAIMINMSEEWRQSIIQ
jgi:hypothetical protein